MRLQRALKSRRLSMPYNGEHVRVREACDEPKTKPQIMEAVKRDFKLQVKQLDKILDDLIKDGRMSFDPQSKTYLRLVDPEDKAKFMEEKPPEPDPMDPPAIIALENRDPEVAARHEKKLEELRKRKEAE